MRLRMFRKKQKNTKDVALVDDSAVQIVTIPKEVSMDSASEMQKVVQTTDEIKKQNPLQALLSRSKNERALAENDVLISSAIKNILNWLAVITSAETVRKDEYDALTEKMLQLDEDVNAQLEMQVKFKKAHQNIMKKQEEQKVLVEKVDKLQKQNQILKIVTCVTFLIGCIALVVALI